MLLLTGLCQLLASIPGLSLEEKETDMTRTFTAEIVTFRAAPGISAEEMRTRAADIAGWLERQPGFIARTLSHADDDIWTDHVLWQSLADAKAAGEKIMAEPCAQALMAAIDMQSVRMSHAPVAVHQMAGAPVAA
jgi:heme-degrading monooxygenase HmoA